MSFGLRRRQRLAHRRGSAPVETEAVIELAFATAKMPVPPSSRKIRRHSLGDALREGTGVRLRVAMFLTFSEGQIVEQIDYPILLSDAKASA